MNKFFGIFLPLLFWFFMGVTFVPLFSAFVIPVAFFKGEVGETLVEIFGYYSIPFRKMIPKWL